MQSLMITPTSRTPAIEFDFAGNHLSVKGESYPEDTAAFYGPVMQELKRYLAHAASHAAIVIDIELVYFNSSSAKALMNFFQVLESAANDRQITINWYYQEDDETMQEFGEDLSEDLVYVRFNLCRVSP